MPRDIPKNGFRHPPRKSEPPLDLRPFRVEREYKWNARKRTAEEARQENPETVYHESRDLAAAAQREGLKEGLELLERIRKAGSNKRALAACRFERVP